MMPEKRLYENKQNLQVYSVMKLGCCPDNDDFEPNFKSVVQINQFTNIGQF